MNVELATWHAAVRSGGLAWDLDAGVRRLRSRHSESGRQLITDLEALELGHRDA